MRLVISNFYKNQKALFNKAFSQAMGCVDIRLC